MQNLKALMVGTVLGTAAISGVAQAEVSANIGVASEYVFRGIQSSNGAQVFGGVDWESDTSGLYAGTWVSNATLGATGNDTEVDLYGGYAFKISDGLSLDLGYIAYLVPSDAELSSRGAGRFSHGNNSEIYFGLAGANWSGTVWYNFGNDNVDDDERVYIEANVEFPLQGKLGLGLHVGHTIGTGDAFDNVRDDSYTDYGISLNAGDFSLSVTNTDIDDQHSFFVAGTATDRPVVTVSWSKSWDGLTK